MTSSSPGSLPKTQQHPQESRVPTLSTPLTHDLEDEAPVYIPKLQRAQGTARAPLLHGGAGLGNYYIIRLIPEARLTPPHSWGQPRNSDRQTDTEKGWFSGQG